MSTDDPLMKELYMELEDYERRGVPIKLDGSRVSPMQVVAAFAVKESGSYMRDYVLNPKGNIEELVFDNIAEG